MINKNGSLDSQTLEENHFGMPVNELNNSVPPQYSLLVILQNLFNKLNTKKSTSRPIDQPVLIHLFKLKIKVRILRKLRPSSDVVLLPCRTKLQFGSTVARQEIYSDSDVVPESNQIQGLLEPRNNSPPNSPRERNLARTY